MPKPTTHHSNSPNHPPLVCKKFDLSKPAKSIATQKPTNSMSGLGIILLMSALLKRQL